MSKLKANELDSQSGGDILCHQNIVFADGKGFGKQSNWIGVVGGQGFGVGICPNLPSGFSEISGTTDPTHANYGNYQYLDGSIMVWIPAFYYKVGVDNIIQIASEAAFQDQAAANAEGYALHRAFKDAGVVKRGFFVDKYQCSNNAGVASSVRNGNPLSTNEAHNHIAALDGTPTNSYYGVIDAVKTRGGIFACCSRFIYAALAMLSQAHGQASANSTFCGWYDATYNFPKGCNNNALGDANDAAVSYTSDGYSNCGKTGSGAPFEKTTHNGQASGVADLNGNMWEISLGLVRPGASYNEAVNDALGTSKFHVLKETVALSDMTHGWNNDATHGVSPDDAWGTDAFLDTNYQELSLPHIGASDGWQYFGNAANQVLDAATSGDGWLKTGLGIYRDGEASSAGGTNMFGVDGIYEFHTSNLCARSGGDWSSGSLAGVWTLSMSSYRTSSFWNVGFRAACYPV